MIVDPSAIIAILSQEADAQDFADAMAAANSLKISAGSYLEAAIVLDSRGSPAASAQLDALIANGPIEIVSVTAEQARSARDAYRRFGKGNHPAKLNFGDCFAYALSKTTGEPLLFKGEDFAKTDVAAAL